MSADGVAASLEALAVRGVDPAAEIYARMFAAHPETAHLFARDSDGGIKGHMLYEAIEAALDIGGANGYGANLIGCEVINHQNLGVAPDVFVSFYATMRDVVGAALGADWTPDMDGAWRDLIARVDEITKERLAQSSAPITSLT